MYAPLVSYPHLHFQNGQLFRVVGMLQVDPVVGAVGLHYRDFNITWEQERSQQPTDDQEQQGYQDHI